MAVEPHNDLPIETRAGRVLINIQWLLKLRWAAVLGQLYTVLTIYFLGITIPLATLSAIIAATAISNLALGAWFVRNTRRGEWVESSERGEWLEGSVMVVDILFLTALLYFTGGSSNPFAVFYVVHVALAAVLLRSSWTWVLTALTVGCYAFLFVSHVALPALEEESLRSRGMLVAFIGAASMIAYFVVRVTGELSKRDLDLHRARQRKAASDRLASLVTLAAGAAHELSTPLSTIAVVAKELERELDRLDGSIPHENVEDVRLIRQEVTRCRAILDQMAADSGDAVGEEMSWVTIDELLANIVEPLHAYGEVEVCRPDHIAEKRIYIPRRALVRVLRGLVKNGLDASAPERRSVRLAVSIEDDVLRCEVADRGAGMSPDVLERALEPFFTTKEPGRGMGLGLYLARTVLERLGGRLDMSSAVNVGTSVTASLPVLPRPAIEAGEEAEGESESVPSGASS